MGFDVAACQTNQQYQGEMPTCPLFDSIFEVIYDQIIRSSIETVDKWIFSLGNSCNKTFKLSKCAIFPAIIYYINLTSLNTHFTKMRACNNNVVQKKYHV